MKRLTDKQADILLFILSFSKDNGYPPTRSEIASNFNFSSANAASDHLMALHRKGVIYIAPGVARGIKVIAA